MAIGPNGHLYVAAAKTSVPADCCGNDARMGAVHEFDVEEQRQVRIIGQNESFESADDEHLDFPRSIAFKPLQGDYTSVGGGFQGDWKIDLYDHSRFAGVSNFTLEPVFTGPGVECLDAHALLSFDFDRDTDIDLQDFARFQRDIGTDISVTP